MFNNTTFFLQVKSRENGNEIMRLNLTRDSQDLLCELFVNATALILNSNNTFVEFNGGYRPDAGEVQLINNYTIGQEIINALTEPTSIVSFTPDLDCLPEIKGIFTGVIEPEVVVAFQKFNKNQYITRKGISLLHNRNTFEKISSFGISIEDSVDCVYKDNKLFFKTFFSARQALDLSQYYRLATDKDIDSFISHPSVNVNNEQAFRENADTWVRRKIALIYDSGTLNQIPPSEIAEKASEYNLTIEIIEEQGMPKINLPNEKTELKHVLKFLDDEIYKGPLSSNTYETNSKKKLGL
jgi:hypothetical protein